MTSDSTPPFKAPPRDGSLTAAQLLDWHTAHNPDWVIAKLGAGQQDGDDTATASVPQARAITWSVMAQSIHATARYFADQFGIDVDAGADAYPRVRPTVAIIANVEPLQYFIVFWSLLRIGAVPFALSTNNSEEAIAHLVTAGRAQAVLGGPKGTSPALDATIDAALKKRDGDAEQLHRITWPDASVLFDARDVKPITTYPPSLPSDRLCGVHSSGSTSFPKPIFARQESITWMMNMVSGDVQGKQVLFSSLPPFHAFSLYWGGLSSLGSGHTILVRAPVTPPAPITPQGILADLETLRPDIFLSVPSLYKAWSKNPAAVDLLRRTHLCVSAGGPLDYEAAAFLQSQQVPITNMLASSEIGPVSSLPSKAADPFSFELNPAIDVILRPQETSDEKAVDGTPSTTFEVVVAPKGPFHPLVTNETIDGSAVYATSDLVSPVVGTNPKRYTVVGRVDDQIMHSTGEKTNPGPLIAIIERHPAVQVCCYFGRGKRHAGLLVEPTSDHAIATLDDDVIASYRDAIWPAVEKANAFAPSHSRLYKEMIVVATTTKPLPKTPKGSIRTGVALREYAPEIERAYERFESMSVSSVVVPNEWTTASTREYVRRVVADVLDLDINNDDKDDTDTRDLFSWGGANSMSSTRIRSILAATLPGDKTQRLEPNFVYANPTVEAMAQALLQIRTTGDVVRNAADEVARKVRACEAMLEKYTHDWPVSSTAGASPVAGLHVLVTGTTGGLGAHLVDLLLSDESVAHVYALNRKSSRHSLAERQRSAFTSRGISAKRASHAKLSLIEADLTEPQFGLSRDVYDNLVATTTLVVHNAWQLDFNLALASFEPHIKASRALVDFALCAPARPRVVFTSSIATTSGHEGNGKVPEEPHTSFHPSVGGGYGESKAVVEHLLRIASEKTGLHSTVARIGQLSGSRTNGAWSTTEWLPLIVKSADVLQCVPMSNGVDDVSWIPMDVGARVLLDMATAPKEASAAHAVYHIVHPRTASWNALMWAVARRVCDDSLHGHNIDLVPYAEWLARLEASQKTTSAETLPTLKLLEFYKGVSDLGKEDASSKEAMGIKRLDTASAERVSEALRNAKRLDEQSAHQWVRYWKDVGFLA